MRIRTLSVDNLAPSGSGRCVRQYRNSQWTGRIVSCAMSDWEVLEKLEWPHSGLLIGLSHRLGLFQAVPFTDIVEDLGRLSTLNDDILVLTGQEGDFSQAALWEMGRLLGLAIVEASDFAASQPIEQANAEPLPEAMQAVVEEFVSCAIQTLNLAGHRVMPIALALPEH